MNTSEALIHHLDFLSLYNVHKKFHKRITISLQTRETSATLQRLHIRKKEQRHKNIKKESNSDILACVAWGINIFHEKDICQRLVTLNCRKCFLQREK